MVQEKYGLQMKKWEKENYQRKNNRYEVRASIIKEESIGKIRNIKKLTKKQEEMIAPTTAQQ